MMDKIFYGFITQMIDTPKKKKKKKGFMDLQLSDDGQNIFMDL